MGIPATTRNASAGREGDTYMLPSAKANTKEQARLDAMHEGVSGFFGGRLTFADLGKPKRILEVGAGSGSWAIHAAKDYPDAEVIAIDISPLPPRALPKNLKSFQMDVCQPLPFEEESFDVIHARFVLMHVPHFRDVLARISTLIKPGGHLILEDIDPPLYSENKETPEAVTYFYDRITDWVAAKGVTYVIGGQLQPYLSRLGLFTDVTVKVLTVPFSPGWDGPLEAGALGNTMKHSLLGASPMLVDVVPGFTEDSVERWRLALEEPEHKLRLSMYFLAARKSYKPSQIQNTEIVLKEEPLPSIRSVRRPFSTLLSSSWTGKGLTVTASWFVSLFFFWVLVYCAQA